MKRMGAVVAAWLVLTGCTPELRAAFTQIVAFGDSLTDEGNVFLATGGTFPASPPYFQGQFSNGPVWLTQLAARLGLPNPGPSLAGGTDYAFAGAETHSASGLSTEGTPNLDTQIGLYLQAHPTGFTGSQLIVVWGGANDFLNVGQTNPSVPVSNLAQEITAISQAGGKYFLVPNLPPLGEIPAIKSQGPAAEAAFNALSGQFDSQLAAKEQSLEATLGITIYPVDVSGAVQAILANPASFGFTDVTDQAKSGGVGTPGSVVPNPDQYLFWDPIHPTAHAHQLIGDVAFEAVSVPEPSSALLLGLGALGLLGHGWRRRKPAA